MKKYTPEYCSEIAASWVKLKNTTIFHHNVRKVYTGRGEWHIAADWSIYGCDGKWHNIDAVEFVKLLGGTYDPQAQFFGNVLKSLGYRVHDEGGALCVVGECDA